MKLLDSLEKRFGHLAVSNVILGLVIGQLLVYALMLSGRLSVGSLVLNPHNVVVGHEYWRLITFIICPPFLPQGAFDALFLALFWYIFWMMGGALEAAWGAFRFNVYLLAGVFFTVLGAFVGYWMSPVPDIWVNPRFLYMSVFFAFAVFHPNFEFYLMFVLPVKVKWLAYVIGGITLLGIIGLPTWGHRLAALGPFLNFFLFFRGAFVHSVQSRQRRAKFAAEKKKPVMRKLFMSVRFVVRRTRRTQSEASVTRRLMASLWGSVTFVVIPSHS